MPIITLSKKELCYLIEACATAIASEDALIDAYSDAHDGSETMPIKKAKLYMRRWQKLIEKLKAVVG